MPSRFPFLHYYAFINIIDNIIPLIEKLRFYFVTKVDSNSSTLATTTSTLSTTLILQHPLLESSLVAIAASIPKVGAKIPLFIIRIGLPQI